MQDAYHSGYVVHITLTHIGHASAHIHSEDIAIGESVNAIRPHRIVIAVIVQHITVLALGSAIINEYIRVGSDLKVGAVHRECAVYIVDDILISYIIHSVFHNDCIRNGMGGSAHGVQTAAMSDGNDAVAAYKATARYRIFSTRQRCAVIYF